MKNFFNTKKEQEKAILFGVVFDNKEDYLYQLTELNGLAETAGLLVVHKDYQYVREINASTVIGRGKVEEIKQKIDEFNADVVIVDTDLTGSQIKNLSEVWGVKVVDKLGLILDIFAQRATSQEGKLQVQLAQLQYSLPRLSSLSGTSGKFGGGVGMRGPGETKLELNRRKIEDNILKLQKELKQIKMQRQLKRKNREKSNKHSVAIVGYTNAGKSTLLNLISKANIYADNKLFATLDTTSRNVFLTPKVQIILTDTVGFISKLSPNLIDAFASTLEEVKSAELILHVVDISNKNYKEQMSTVQKILNRLGACDIPIINVYNKSDKIGATPFIKLKKNEVIISAKNNEGIDKLKNLILKQFND